MKSNADELDFIARVIWYLESQTNRPEDCLPNEQEPPLILSNDEQIAVRATLVAHESMRMSPYRTGRLQIGVVLLLMKMRDKAELLHQRGFWAGKSLHDLAKVLAFGVRALPRRVIPWLSMQAVKRKPAITLSENLRQQIYKKALPLHPLLRCVSDLPQNRDGRAFEVDAERHIVVGSVIGFDALRCADGFTILESNTGVGLPIHSVTKNNVNPFVEGIFGFAEEHQFRNVVVFYNGRGLEGRQDEQYAEAASRFGISLKIIEPDCATSGARPRSSFIPEFSQRDTVCVRIRDFPTWPDFLMSNKVSVQDTLQSFLTRNAKATLRVPDTTAGWRDRIEWDSGRYPNLVEKMGDAGGGLGVTFYKARNWDHAKELMRARRQRPFSRIGGMHGEFTRRTQSPEVMLQPFNRAVLSQDDRLAIYRINVLITPVGNKMLSVDKYVGAAPVPESLPYGIVQNPVPYLVNGDLGATEQHPDESEFVELESVADTLGEAMASLMNAHFLITRRGDTRASG